MSGHLTLFPGDWQAIASRCLTITVLRDPRERLISWYFQLRRGAEYEVDPWVATAKSLELRPFLRHILDVGYRGGTSLCADWLSTIAWDGGGRLTEEDALRLSCEALDYIDLVGFVDRLDDVGDVLSQRFGHHHSPLPRLNPSTSEEWAGVDEEAWTLAEAATRLDYLVYSEARRRSEGGRAITSERWGSMLFDLEPVAFPPLEFGDRLASFDSLTVNGKGAGVESAARVGAGTLVDIQFSLSSSLDLDDVTIGLSLRPAHLNRVIFGINSRLLGHRIALRRQQTGRFRYQLLANLLPGLYMLSLTCHRGLSHIEGCHHWWNEAALLEIVPAPRLPRHDGPVWLPVRFGGA